MKDDFDYGSHDCCSGMTRQDRMAMKAMELPLPKRPLPRAKPDTLRTAAADDKPKAQV